MYITNVPTLSIVEDIKYEAEMKGHLNEFKFEVKQKDKKVPYALFLSLIFFGLK